MLHKNWKDWIWKIEFENNAGVFAMVAYSKIFRIFEFWWNFGLSFGKNKFLHEYSFATLQGFFLHRKRKNWEPFFAENWEIFEKLRKFRKTQKIQNPDFKKVLFLVQKGTKIAEFRAQARNFCKNCLKVGKFWLFVEKLRHFQKIELKFFGKLRKNSKTEAEILRKLRKSKNQRRDLFCFLQKKTPEMGLDSSTSTSS